MVHRSLLGRFLLGRLLAVVVLAAAPVARLPGMELAALQGTWHFATDAQGRLAVFPADAAQVPTLRAALAGGPRGLRIQGDQLATLHQWRASYHRIDDASFLLDWADREDWRNLVLRRDGPVLWRTAWYAETPLLRDGHAALSQPWSAPEYAPIGLEDLLGFWQAQGPVPEAAWPFVLRRAPDHIGQTAVKNWVQKTWRQHPQGSSLLLRADGRVEEYRSQPVSWQQPAPDRWLLGRLPDFPQPVRLVMQDGQLQLLQDDLRLPLVAQRDPAAEPEDPIGFRMRQAMTVLGCPGALAAVVPDAGPVRTWVLGHQDAAGQQPMQADLHFPIASLSKVFVGQVLLRLAQAGQLALDEPVRRYLPALPAQVTATVREVAQHRSGLFNPIESAAFQAAVMRDPRRNWSMRRLLEWALEQPLYHQPGSGFHYSNANSVLLALLAEAVSGRSYDQLLAQEILQPLGMRNTGRLAGRQLPAPHAQAYRHAPAARPIGYGVEFLPVNDYLPGWTGPGGDMISTLDDLVRGLPALLRGTLLDPQRQEALRSTCATGVPDWRYGFHLSQHQGDWGHKGDVPGWSVYGAYQVARKRTLIVLCNLSNAADGRQPASALARILATLP